MLRLEMGKMEAGQLSCSARRSVTQPPPYRLSRSLRPLALRCAVAGDAQQRHALLRWQLHKLSSSSSGWWGTRRRLAGGEGLAAGEVLALHEQAAAVAS
jgi:hypothetical protein